MIAATVEELTPIYRHQAGVPGAGRRAGRRASHDLSSPTAARAPASAARGRHRPGRCQSLSARLCSRCCTHSGSWMSRRKRPTRRCWAKARTCARH